MENRYEGIVEDNGREEAMNHNTCNGSQANQRMIMKVLVFGATGSVGSQLADQALEQGHEVSAFVRDPAALELTNPRLSVIQGNVLDYSAVEEAVRGSDEVLSALGTPMTTHNNVRSQGTRNIVTAMETTRVSRLVSLSSMGIGDSRHMLPKFYKYFLVPLLLRQGFAEHELQERLVRESEIDWVIVRPGAYTNGLKTGEYRHGLSDTREKLKVKVSRADVADFMITQLIDETYLRHSPWISY